MMKNIIIAQILIIIIAFAATGCGGGAARMPEDLDLGTLIAYVCFDDDREICVVAADGSWTAQLTNNVRPDYAPAINKKGEIVYSCKESLSDDEEICAMRADGSDQRQLTENDLQDTFATINDESQVLYVCETDEKKEEFPDQNVRHLCGINFDGSDFHQITQEDHGSPSMPAMNNAGQVIFPCLDGNGRQICIINFDGTGLAKLTGEAVTYQASSINDLGKIACTFYDQQDHELCTLSSDGSGYRQLTNNTGHDTNVDISRLGRLVFTCKPDENPSGICFMNSNGTGLIQLAPDAEEAMLPSFLAEDLVAFSCRVEEEPWTFEVCVIKITGAGFQVLTDNKYNPR